MAEFQLLNFIPIFLYAFKVRPLKNVKNKFKALLSYEVVFLQLFKLFFWTPWVLKYLPSNFQQPPMITG